MKDKNGVTIKRGLYARYGGEIYKVLFAGFWKIVLFGKDGAVNLKTHGRYLKDRVYNIEIIPQTLERV